MQHESMLQSGVEFCQTSIFKKWYWLNEGESYDARVRVAVNEMLTDAEQLGRKLDMVIVIFMHGRNAELYCKIC